MASGTGRAHPNCVKASNPYHECGTACLERIGQRQGQGQKDIQKKKLDYHNGVKEGVLSKMKDEQRKVNPNCTKASNPYHECGEHCIKGNAEAGARGFKKESDYRSGVKEVVVNKKKIGQRKVNPNCIKASNPYHECGEHCFKRNGEAGALGVNKESGSWSREKKDSDSQPSSSQAPRVVDEVAVGGQKAETQHARVEYLPKKNAESKNGKSLSSSEPLSSEILPEDHSFNVEKVLSTQAVPPSENVKMSDRSKDSPMKIVTSPTGAQSKDEKNDKLQSSHNEIYIGNEDVGECIPSPTDQSRNFSFSGVDHITPGHSDDEEVQSVISDCVSVGKYHVRASFSSTLQSIIDKYGDIAANCKLDSNSMRTYYLQCLCSVVQELESTALTLMTKAKVREMRAVVQDVESAQINVNWLQNILNQISEAIELSTEHLTIEAAKASCDNLLESTRKELESQMQELALKEDEIANLNELVAETKSRLTNLELESKQLELTIQAKQSMVKKLSRNSLADEIL